MHAALPETVDERIGNSIFPLGGNSPPWLREGRLDGAVLPSVRIPSAGVFKGEEIRRTTPI